MSERVIVAGLIVVLAVLVGIGLWQTSADRERPHAALVRRPVGVMGTECTLAALVTAEGQVAARKALAEAEAALRAVEARMSNWLTDSELSRFNAAPAGEQITLSTETMQVLAAARAAVEETRGAFDVTCRPLIELWARAGKEQRMPTGEALAAARAQSHWDLLELLPGAVRKRSAGVAVDLGGIAKGYGIDLALDALRRGGVGGALVDVGGDLACYVPEGRGHVWPVEIRNPFGNGMLGRLKLESGAVCTSGNYARFIEIAGKRYSHIVDPRTGWPADLVPSVTVFASRAMTADVWATALSVLGIEGLPLLPEAVEALLVFGSPAQYEMRCTAGFPRFAEPPLRDRLVVWNSALRYPATRAE